MFAYAAHAREGILGVFRSDDRGTSWQSVGGGHFANEKAGAFSSAIAVHPDNPDWVVCGGQDLHRTKDGGGTWEQVTECELPESDPHFAPAWRHALAVTPEGWIYDANGGGLGFSDDFGQTWSRRCDGLATTMCYKVDVATPQTPVVVSAYTVDATTPGGTIMLAGLHNDGVLLHGAPGVGETGCFRRELRGEGGWVIFDPEDPAHMFATAPGAVLHRHTAAGGWSHISPPGLTADEKADVWLPIIAMDGGKDRATPRPVLFGTTRIWKSTDDGDSWRPVSVELDGSPVTAIHICPVFSRRIYLGTEWGSVHRSDDGGNTWTENLGGLDLPYRYITRIATLPEKPDHVLATIGPLPPPAKSMNFDPYSHIYLSTDGGRHWRNADPRRQLPKAPHNCVVFDGRDGFFAATDFGVYHGSFNEDKAEYAWEDMSGDLPEAFVTDLVVHPESGTITAATYGRGLFRRKIGPEAEPERWRVIPPKGPE